MKFLVVSVYFCCLFGYGISTAVPNKDVKNGLEWGNMKSLLPLPIDPLKLNSINQTYCTCGVFFSGQFKKGSNEPPKGYPVLMHEQDTMYPCTPMGTKQCSNKCLETVIFLFFTIGFSSTNFNSYIFIPFQIVKHLPNSPAILCGSIDRDVFRERAYLFIQDCNSTWVNTNFSAGREFCCKNGSPYKCPNSLI